MKNFDIELARRGKLVCNGYGDDVRIICFDRIDDDCPVVALHKHGSKELICAHHLDGRVFGTNEKHDLDLFMKTDKEKEWINIYENLSNGRYPSRIYLTKDEAISEGNKEWRWIDTVEIEWEE